MLIINFNDAMFSPPGLPAVALGLAGRLFIFE